MPAGRCSALRITPARAVSLISVDGTLKPGTTFISPSGDWPNLIISSTLQAALCIALAGTDLAAGGGCLPVHDHQMWPL